MNYNALPNDPVMLLSFVNTQLRDNYSSLTEFCHAFDADTADITAKLGSIEYDAASNQFI